MLIGETKIEDLYNGFDEDWDDGYEDYDGNEICGARDSCRYCDDSEFQRDRKGVRNKRLGKRGEDAAARYLELIGYEVLERNWTCPAGEADIIARDGQAVVFIEVKTRRGIQRGFPEEAVTAEKRQRYEKISAFFLRKYDETDIPVRFDVIALLVISEDRALIKHYINAYGCGC